MYKVGIDLGGTNIVAGVVDAQNKIIAKSSRKTNCPRPAEEIVDDIAVVAFEAIKAAKLTPWDIEVAGIGSPGAIDPVLRKVCFASNLGFENVMMGQMLKDRTGIDFYLENDANAAAYGEYIAGAGIGAKNFVLITIGTGIGGGIIINKKLYSGSNYAGAELGHTVISMNGEPCSCGRKGCFEAYASATALVRQTKQAMQNNFSTKMWKICGGNIDNVNGLTAFDGMRKGDKVAEQVVEQYITYLAEGVTNLVNIFQPDIVCIGGGISKEGKPFADRVQEYVRRYDFTRNVAIKPEIKVATLGNDAGIIGAANIYNLYK